jgi:hypothetical protein
MPRLTGDALDQILDLSRQGRKDSAAVKRHLERMKDREQDMLLTALNALANFRPTRIEGSDQDGSTSAGQPDPQPTLEE